LPTPPADEIIIIQKGKKVMDDLPTGDESALKFLRKALCTYSPYKSRPSNSLPLATRMK
jgi:hypothetical protein